MLHQAKVEQGLTCLCIKATFYFHDIHELTQREEGRKGRSWATGSIFLHLEIQTMERRRKERESERVRLCCLLRWVLRKRVGVEHTQYPVSAWSCSRWFCQ